MGDLNQYDGTELSIVVEYTLEDGSRTCESMATIELDEVDLTPYREPEVFYPVYLHLKTGGAECAADFSKLEDARMYCCTLDSIMGWKK
jgi:hypothetical protein